MLGNGNEVVGNYSNQLPISYMTAAQSKVLNKFVNLCLQKATLELPNAKAQTSSQF